MNGNLRNEERNSFTSFIDNHAFGCNGWCVIFPIRVLEWTWLDILWVFGVAAADKFNSEAMNPHPPISKQTLVAFLFDQGIDPVRATDAMYALPDEEWLATEFAVALQAEQRAEGLDRYVEGKNNCTKFSRHAADFAARCHLRTEDDAEESTAIAFGVFDYIKPNGTGHSVNIAVCRNEDGSLKVTYFEPQLCSLIIPSRQENSPCDTSF